MNERILEATVAFTMVIRDDETYEEARERFMDCVLMQTSTLADHEVDWSLEYCEEV